MTYRIERATERALVAGGVDPRDVDQLARLALRRHGRARRRLETAVSGRLRIAEGDGRVAFEEGYQVEWVPDARHFGLVVTLFADLTLADGVRWSGDRLQATLPAAASSAAVGRRLDEVVDHPWLPGDARIVSWSEDGSFRTTPTHRELDGPGVRTALRRLRVRRRLLLDEMTMGSPFPAWARWTITAVALNLATLAVLATTGAVGEFGASGLAATWCGVLLCGSQAANAWRGRPRSLVALAGAASRHAERLGEAAA